MPASSKSAVKSIGTTSPSRRASVEAGKIASNTSPSTASTVETSSIHNLELTPAPVTAPPLLYHLYTRVYSTELGEYFFVDEETNRTQWEQPAEGVVASTDESTGREFYTCCASGISAWTVESLLEKLAAAGARR